MSVEKRDVLRTAALAGLRLAPDEVERLAGELADVLRRMEALPDPGTLTTGDEQVDPPVGQEPVSLRADRPDPDPLARPPSALAPAWNAGFFTVPRLAALDADADLDADLDPDPDVDPDPDTAS